MIYLVMLKVVEFQLKKVGSMDLGGMEKDYRNTGGFVEIGSKEKADDVPARLSVNEFDLQQMLLETQVVEILTKEQKIMEKRNETFRRRRTTV